MRATGQNGSSRHVLVFLNSISSRINEQSSGLLILWFGLYVRYGRPILTWDFTIFRSLSDAGFVPFACSRVLGPVLPGCQIWPDWPRPVCPTGLGLYSGCRERLQGALFRCRHAQRLLPVKGILMLNVPRQADCLPGKREMAPRRSTAGAVCHLRLKRQVSACALPNNARKLCETAHPCAGY